MEFEEKTVSTKQIFQGRIINVKVDTVELPEGKKATRELVEHNGGAAVIALDENERVLIVKQYRKPYNESIFEIPAGKLEKGEDPLVCALRELHEETGYTADNAKHLFTIYPTPGYCSEKIYIYLAENPKKGTQKLDEDEFLDVYHYPLDELCDMIDNQEINDAKTIAAVLKVKLLKERFKHE